MGFARFYLSISLGPPRVHPVGLGPETRVKSQAKIALTTAQRLFYRPFPSIFQAGPNEIALTTAQGLFYRLFLSFS